MPPDAVAANPYPWLLYLMAALYVAAGVSHLLYPAPYRAIMPPWLPAHALLVLVSGILEIVFGLLLLLPVTRVPAAWCIITLLVAMFPANVQMAINFYKAGHTYLWLALLRLPVQLLLVYWAWRYTR